MKYLFFALALLLKVTIWVIHGLFSVCWHLHFKQLEGYNTYWDRITHESSTWDGL